MADYIKREDALAIVEKNQYCFVNESTIDKDLRALPAADVVEVVRCKDCVHRVTDEDTCIRWCIANGGIRDDDFFCADGKRKEDAT